MTELCAPVYAFLVFIWYWRWSFLVSVLLVWWIQHIKKNMLRSSFVISLLRGYISNIWWHMTKFAIIWRWCLFGLIESGSILSQHSHLSLLVYHAVKQDDAGLIQSQIHQQIEYILMCKILRQQSNYSVCDNFGQNIHFRQQIIDL